MWGLKPQFQMDMQLLILCFFSSPPEEDTLQRSVSQMRQQIAQCSDPKTLTDVETIKRCKEFLGITFTHSGSAHFVPHAQFMQ